MNPSIDKKKTTIIMVMIATAIAIMTIPAIRTAQHLHPFLSLQCDQ